ncbi:RNA-binding protein L [Magnolia sinica]|uniref:RNA-binding protein L n=1 Tax=Magnolia sinica TaxID=86752 RepID=UPI002658D930|nr:RNA-binding protein L [Magnolia sinica]
MEDMSGYYHQTASLHNPPHPYYPQPYPPPPSAAPAPPPPHPSYQHHQQQQPYALPHHPHPLPHPSIDEVRTLFIAGLPGDAKHREIYNLFREFPGYESCQLRSSGQSSQAFAFAVFSDQQSAVAAIHALNGLMFDLEKESTLHIDLAKSNSRSKRSRPDDGRPYYSEKKVKGSAAFSRNHPDAGVGSNMHFPGMGNSAYNMNGYPSTQSHGSFGNEAVNDTRPKKISGKSSAPNAPQANTPCPTIFVANLGPTCSEQELNQVFSRCPGFLKAKMQNKNGVPVAFVDFQDVASSTGALHQLQGTFLYSSVGEGMRLEYAKSRMGMRKRERR